MANNNPEQIDISLNVLGQDNVALMQRFVSQVSDLQDSMRDLITRQESIRGSLGAVIPQVASTGRQQPVTRGGVVLPPGVEQPMEGQAAGSESTHASTPPDATIQSRARSKLAGRRVPTITEQEAPVFSGGAAPPGQPQGASTPPGDENTAGKPWWYSKVRPFEDTSFMIPRYGDFNVQDLSGMIAHNAGHFAAPRRRDIDARRANEALGIFSDDEGTRAPSSLVNAVGMIGGVAEQTSRIAPYVKAFEQVTGTRFGPTQLQNAGRGYGLERGGVDLNIPGTSFGFTVPGSQFFGPAGGEMLGQMGSAIKGGMQSGISIRDMRQVQEALSGQGYLGKERSTAENTITGLMRDKRTPGFGSAQAYMPVLSQALMYGGDGLKTFTDIVKQIGPAAHKARMGVDEFWGALDQVANDQQKKGLTYDQGVKRTMQFTGSTGLPPQLLSAMQDNPMFQARMMATTGLPPQAQGLAPLGSQMDAMYSNIGMLDKAFAGMGGPRSINIPDEFGGGKIGIDKNQAKDAMVAQYAGLPSVDVLKQLRDNRKKYEARGYLSSAMEAYDTQAEAVASSGADDATKKGAYGHLYQGEVDGTPGMSKIFDLMKRSGLSAEQRTEVMKAAPTKRAEVLNDILAKDNPTRAQDPNKVIIEPSPELRRFLHIREDGHKRAANNGQVGVNVPAGQSPYSIPNWRPGP